MKCFENSDKIISIHVKGVRISQKGIVRYAKSLGDGCSHHIPVFYELGTISKKMNKIATRRSTCNTVDISYTEIQEYRNVDIQ